MPVVVLASIYYSNAKKQIIEEYEITHQYALAQTVDGIDRRLQEFNVIASQMANDILLTPFEMRHTHYSKIIGINRLRTYFARTDYLEELMIYYYGDDMLYCSSGTSSLKTMSETSYVFIGPWEFDDLARLLNSKKKLDTSPHQCFLRIKGSDQNQNLIVLTSPCPPSAVSSYGTVVGLVNYLFFQSLLDALNSSLTSESFILDSNNSILVASENNPSVNQSMINSFMSTASDNTSQKVTIDGKMFSLLTIRSKTNGWNYLTIFPHDQFTQRFFIVQTPLLLTLASICIAGIFMSVVLAVKNYQPVRKLNELLDTNQMNDKYSNEFYNINQAVQEMINRNRAMNLQLNENRSIIIQSYLMNLLSGHVDENQKTAMQALEKEEIFLSGPYYCVFILRLPAKVRAEIRETILNEIHELKSTNLYSIDIEYKNYIAVIFSYGSNHDRQLLSREMNNLVYERYHFSPHIGVGQSYKRLHQVSRSYVEAIAAIETITDELNDNIVCFDNLQSIKFTGAYWYQPKSQLRLLQVLRQGNMQSLSESMDELHQLLKAYCQPENSVQLRFMTSSIIIRVLPLIDDMNLDDLDEEINGLIHYVSLEDFINRLSTLCKKLLFEIERDRQKKKEDLFRQIVTYMDIHYADQNISLKSLADQFDITTSFLSRFFKDNARMNFIDYLTDKRLSYACKLLVETNMTVKEIIREIGYIDLASFTRKFTQIMGISPGRYRQDKRIQKP
jgi:YesN/AraC family two-component response regulator